MKLFLFLILFSCSKSEDTDTNTNTGKSYISMKIYGVIWKGETNFASGLVQNNFSGSALFKLGAKNQTTTLAFSNANLYGVNVLDRNGGGALFFYDGDNNIT